MNYRQILLITILLLILSLTSACQQQPEPTPTSISSQPTDIPTAIPPTLTATATAVTPTDTPSPTNTTTSVPSATLPPSVTPSPTTTTTATPIPEIIVNQGATMTYIPSGRYPIGGVAEDLQNECRSFRSGCQQAWYTPSEPIHEVQLDPYYIDIYEVTNQQFVQFLNTFGTHESVCFGEICLEVEQTRIVIEDGLYSVTPAVNDFPVFGATWFGAAAYCNWRGARLPTEAEWEIAASWNPETETKTTYPWGDEFDGTVVNFCDRQCQERQAHRTFDDGFIIEAPVGSFEAGISPFGLYDMGGNVWEWVLDWYAPDYYENSPTQNPRGPAEGEQRVVRGGSWFDTGNFMSSLIRFPGTPTSGLITVGFRCAIDG